jgi:hypothetical protein
MSADKQSLYSSQTLNCNIPAFDTFYLKLEGYTEALELTVDRTLLLQDRKELFKELLENYISDLKSKNLLLRPDKLLVLEEADWNTINREDPSIL